MKSDKALDYNPRAERLNVASTCVSVEECDRVAPITANEVTCGDIMMFCHYITVFVGCPEVKSFTVSGYQLLLMQGLETM